MKKIILIMLSFTFIMAEISISGDARLRPRYDIKKNGNNSSESDLYYLYRARLNISADIEGGWFFKTKLGTSSVAGMSKMGAEVGDQPGIISSARPSVSFMELYYGYKDDDCGFWGGVIPLEYHPGLDLHFYSDKLVDIPFVLFSNSSTSGFAGYKSLLGHKVNWFFSVDNNTLDSEEFSIAGMAKVDSLDYYTLGVDMAIKLSSLSITPRFLISMGGGENDVHPMTFGGDIKLPTLVDISSSISYYSSVNGSSSDASYYDASHIRFLMTRPIADGKVKFFYDMASNNKDETSFMWLSYTHTCYKGSMGEVTISPTIRLQNGKGAGSDSFDKDYSRSKFEVTTQIKFK